jgi:hypothetical protein
VIIANAIAGSWALGAHRWPALRRRALWYVVIAAEVAMFVQVILGVAAKQIDEIEPTQLHMLYGFSGLFAIAILYGYRLQLQHRLYLLYGLGSLFIMGLGIRALFLHS